MTDSSASARGAGAGPVVSASGEVRLAFIGAGGIAATHATALAAGAPGGRLVAAADPDESRAGALVTAQNGMALSSGEALLDGLRAGRVEADALVVCAPPNVRRAVVGPALELGLDVLVEKPLAANVAEARELAALADRHGDRVTAVGYCHRFTPALLDMRRRVAAGDIGRPTRFENTFAFHHPAMAGSWFSDPEVSGGGSFLDTGCHSLDVFQFLLGRPEVVGAVFDRAWAGRGESSATVLVRSAAGADSAADVHGAGGSGGVGGVIQVGWLEPARFCVRLVGTEGSLFYDYENPEQLTRTAPSGEDESIPVETADVRFERQMAAFVGAVRDRRAAGEAGLATFADGLAVAEAVDAASAGRTL